MTKNIKINIKNSQIAKAINLDSVKSKLAKQQAEEVEVTAKPSTSLKTVKKEKIKEKEPLPPVEQKEEAPRVRARSKSVFAPSQKAAFTEEEVTEPPKEKKTVRPQKTKETEQEEVITSQPSSSSAKEADKEELLVDKTAVSSAKLPTIQEEEKPSPTITSQSIPETHLPPPATPTIKAPPQPPLPVESKTHHKPSLPPTSTPPSSSPTSAIISGSQTEKLGPTGRHIKDLVPSRSSSPPPKSNVEPHKELRTRPPGKQDGAHPAELLRIKEEQSPVGIPDQEDDLEKKGGKTAKFKEFRDIKPTKKSDSPRSFDARDRHGLRGGEEEQPQWRKRRAVKQRPLQEDITIRPSHLKIRIPITIKDLAAEMKLKASQLIAKLFIQGVVTTLNDFLEDETTIQLLGHEFGCEITIDRTETQRMQITDKTIREEIAEAPPTNLQIRAPVVAFMGHVDHGKTSLIDAIRKSNRVAGEAGAITQHIGAFRCRTAVGDITVLDTPGHEAFSAMRARGADVTDIVVLVVAGDEGLRQQTIEAIQHAKAAKVVIVVAINKSDKPNFNAENVYRQLAEQELLPEAWGGQTITINCSATTGVGISNLLEMLALQAEILELKADPFARARGTVLESEMHKGLGAVATVLIQNGTLKPGDALVFGHQWGHVKTMRDEHGIELKEATPSTPVEITGVSGLPQAGQEFVVVKSEREARDIAEARVEAVRQTNLMVKKKTSIESILQQASDGSNKKVLNVVLRADVQGSLEALRVALMKIESAKVDLHIIFAGVGEVSESDIQLSLASKAVIIGFHTQIESHAEQLVKQYGLQVKLHDIIYHAIDDVKALMTGLLDRIPQENDRGKAEVKALFKASQVGIIAGCQVIEGTIHRSHQMRVRRGDTIVWKGSISSLKRVKDDVREVSKGVECGIVLNGFNDLKEGDILESYEITYLTQEL